MSRSRPDRREPEPEVPVPADSGDAPDATKRVRLAVVGSCATRDSFNSRFNPNWRDRFEVVSLLNQISLVSLMDEPSPEGLDQLEPLESYALAEARIELLKDFPATLIASDPDYILFDFFADVHFGVVESHGRYFTDNRWKIAQTAFFKGLPDKRRINAVEHPDEYFCLWESALGRFMDSVLPALPDAKVILHKVRKVDTYIDSAGEVQALKSPYDVPAYNAAWARMDDIFERRYHPRVIDLSDSTWHSFEDHPWGKFLVHYTMDYYADFLEALTRIVDTDARAAGDSPLVPAPRVLDDHGE
jgi:hypothetical protein